MWPLYLKYYHSSLFWRALALLKFSWLLLLLLLLLLYFFLCLQRTMFERFISCFHFQREVTHPVLYLPRHFRCGTILFLHGMNQTLEELNPSM